jgi:hypothetical protein
VDPIRETLERVLASPAFCKSEQCQKFLRYVVDHRGEPIKERNIGVEVFGRTPDYDTSEDPVVRVRATEVRKRLAQYFATPHPQDVKLDLPAGSYHVEFRAPAAKPKSRRHFWIIGFVSSFLLLAALWLWPRSTALDRFWAPAVKGGGPVLIYCGQPVAYFLSRAVHERYGPAAHGGLVLPPDAVIKGNEVIPVAGQFVGIGNSHTAAMVSVLLAKRSKSVEIRYADDLSFGDLRSGPAVLIGAFSNLYTLEMQDKLRFVFEQDGAGRRIRDRSDGRTWQLASLAPDGKTPEDYAVVSRLFDSGTGQFLITAAGITQYGTRAAGEFLTSPSLIGRVTAADWSKNLQVLLRTAVYRGSPGAPEIVLTHAW